MMRENRSNRPEVADIFRLFGPAYRKSAKLPLKNLKAMSAIETCRTAALGGHIDQCDRCGHERISYNSCRNRHCPKCQFMAKEKWLLARKQDLLPIRYFHIVFIIPDALNPLALINQSSIYNALFRSASETLLELGGDPKHLGAEIGVTAVLHTWGQNLMDHPHLHCIVTGGGLAGDGRRWIYPKKINKNKQFFVHVNVISDLFKKKFIAHLKEARQNGDLKFVGKTSYLASSARFTKFKNELYQKKWITYCKETFGGPEQVINYLGRYTHRVAISNHRIVNLNSMDNKVTFLWKDYKDHSQQKPMTLDAFEFIRRFLLHILPRGFYKIRYYGILSNRRRKTKLEQCKKVLRSCNSLENNSSPSIDWIELLLELTGIDLRICPVCNKGRMRSKEMIVSLHYAPP